MKMSADSRQSYLDLWETGKEEAKLPGFILAKEELIFLCCIFLKQYKDT